MQRVIIHRPGGYDRLTLVTEEDPSPRQGEVLVHTRGVGVNFADCIVRMGYYSSAGQYIGWPITPGFDFAGEVARVGAQVTRYKVGDLVLGVTRFGAYQSHIVVPERQLFPIPPGFSMSRAAAFPTVHLTAYYALTGLGRPRPGSKILVHTAAGGVGTAALGLCRAWGLEAWGVVGSEDKVRVARAAGAHQVVVRRGRDYVTELRAKLPGGFDLICEASGVDTLRDSYALLRPTGKLVLFGMGTMFPRSAGRPNPLRLAWSWLRLPRYNPLEMLDANKTVSAFNLSYLFEENDRLEEAMTELLGLAEAGVLPEPPIQEYPLSAVGDAHRALESGRTTGKLVLIPQPLARSSKERARALAAL